ncbi:hypothetical protein JK386_15645 [Nocardioides sp. zg-536]|uniref:NAD glycohydrolase translocation F5/8 type C domain-containing protein n=1 Tax=Nocardioides faecalis TaxID=2803858 RepID=A0A939BZR5_9ACTN|nr:discoidin domain-containing protein [Nocardioides faecalis]MBM9461335.1 hypothetical protein [Nocardioides faecalis]QVI57606.1 hypothetical protein KG111_10955 [Nocardioides faecalis]
MPFVPGPPTPPGGRAAPRGPWWPWALGVAAVVLTAGLGAVLLLGGSEGDEDVPAAQSPVASDSPTTDQDGSPDATGTDGPVEQPDEVEDLAAETSVQVPAVAPASRDRDNKPVDFEAANLIDDDPRTAWRMPGDGTGQILTFDLGDEVVLTEVGLVNGYAKIDGEDDWYRGNRRITAVQWEFDDGTRITQQLSPLPNMQTHSIGPVRTRTVRLHLLEVSAPGRGDNGRDFTAISEVRLTGARG